MATKKQIRNQQITAAPGPLTVGGKTFLVGPPTPADLLNLRRWLRREWAKQPAAAGPALASADLAALDPADRRVFLEAYAGRLTAKREPTEEEAFDLMTSPAGAAYMVWVSARKHQPALTLEEVRSLVTEENVDQVLADFDEATGHADPDDPAPDAIDPKAPGPAS